MKRLLLVFLALLRPALAADPVPQPGLLRSEFIYETAPFPSCHASTIVETKTGLAAAWFGGTREGAPDVGIWLSRFFDGKWTTPAEVADGVQEDGKRFACFNPVLFQPVQGPLLLFYKVGGHPNGWAAFLKTSTDDGATWSAASPLPEGSVGPVKNKPVQLADRSILCPASIETPDKPSKWRVQFERTTDLGKTWTKTDLLNDGLEISAIQPSILFAGGNKLIALGRTRQEKLFRTTSDDSGQTWSPMTLIDLPNPNSGTDAVTLHDGRHLLIYNHTAKGRSPLNLAVSKDGIAWEAALVLESEPGEYSYPAIIQTSDGLVHVTYTWKRQKIRHAVIDPSKLVSHPIVNGVWPAEVHAVAAAPAGISEALQPFIDQHALAGAVYLVADKDKILEQHTLGLADVPAKKPMQPDSLFWIASQSKPIAATALMMMVDAGKVSLDDPVTKYLPEFKDQWLLAEHNDEHQLLKKPEHPILLRYLLSHTSGMLYKTPMEQPTLDVLPLESRMHAYVMSPLQSEPGTKFLYANAGLCTAARIVELMTGQKYEDFITEHIFQPLHMKDTTFWPTDEQLGRLAKAYQSNENGTGMEEAPIPQLRYPLNDRTRYVQPAGGLFSTGADLLNFYRMIMGGGTFEGQRILSPEAVQQMTSKQTGVLPQGYGFGFFVSEGKVSHGGTYGTLTYLDREHQIIAAILMQYWGSAKTLGKFHDAFRKAVTAKYCPVSAATSSPANHPALP